MNYYSYFNFNDFIIALGHKSHVIKNFFLNYNSNQFDFEIDFKNNKIDYFNKKIINWKVALIQTGENTMTGGRIKRLKNYINNEMFLCTYGDGLCDVDLNNLIEFHKSHKKMVTLTAVKPPSRFGELSLDNTNTVSDFREKPELSSGWINAGYFVMNPDIFEFITDDTTVLEDQPLQKIAKLGELKAYQHDGFWQCLDNSRDKEYLENLIINNTTPWIKNITND